MPTMIKRILRVAALLAAATAGRAAAQEFDYYVLALAWAPSYCEAEGDARDAEQCDPARDLGFTLHGLWPQYEDGWPEFCDGTTRDPGRDETAAMADIMGSGGLAWYQWKKHGRCTGLRPDVYFGAARLAFAGVAMPRAGGGQVSATELEQAFLDANPTLSPDGVIVTCRDDLVREVRICLDRDLASRSCGGAVLRGACRYRGELEMPAVR
jgi:ribonuclease T2